MSCVCGIVATTNARLSVATKSGTQPPVGSPLLSANLLARRGEVGKPAFAARCVSCCCLLRASDRVRRSQSPARRNVLKLRAELLNSPWGSQLALMNYDLYNELYHL